MILINHRTANSNMEKNLIMYKIWPGLGEAVCTHPQAFLREFFLF